MRTLLLTTSLWISFLLHPCFLIAQDNTWAKKDSLRKVITETESKEKLKAYARLASYYYVEARDDLKMDTLFTIYEEMDLEAKKQNNINEQGIIRVNKMGVYLNRRMYDELIKIAPEHLDFLSKNKEWKNYYQAYNCLLMAYLYRGDHEMAINKAQQLYEQAEAQQNSEGKAITLYSMAKIYQSQRRFEEHEKCCRQSIELLKNDDSLSHLEAQVWFNLCQSLLTLERYDEVLEAAQEFEKVNERYERFAGTPVPSTRANLWGVYVRLYLKTNEFEKAELYCNKIDSTIDMPAYQIMTQKARAQILNARKQYTEALEIIDSLMELVGDTQTSEANSIRGIKIMILSDMGRAQEAYQLFQVAAAVNDSIRNVQFASQIDKIHTQYEVDKYIAEKKRTRDYLIIAVIGCILLIGGLLIVWRLYRQKQQAYRKLVERSKEWASNLNNTFTSPTTDSTDASLMDEVFRLMEEEHLYYNSDLTLELLADRLGVHRNLLSKAINATQKKNFSQFVNEYRIRKAIEQLSDARANPTMYDIAYSCGFNNTQTFYRLFKTETGLSPSLFRKNSMQS